MIKSLTLPHVQNLVTIGSKRAWLHARNLPLGVNFSFFLSFSLRTATDQPVGPTDAANGSNEAS